MKKDSNFSQAKLRANCLDTLIVVNKSSYDCLLKIHLQRKKWLGISDNVLLKIHIFPPSSTHMVVCWRAIYFLWVQAKGSRRQHMLKIHMLKIRIFYNIDLERVGNDRILKIKRRVY